MIVVYGYNAARHALGVALHSGSGGLCRDPFFDIPKPLFVLEELTCLTTCGDLCRSQKPNTVDSSVSLSVAIGGIIMHAYSTVHSSRLGDLAESARYAAN